MQRAADERVLEIAKDVLQEMGVEGNLITIRRNLNPDDSADNWSVWEIKVPAGHDAILQSFRENLAARTGH